eukprot:CAMPEP_0198203046 /NCGR_PEP_ID=MMETSP1445-20131203/6293_1 /TAXON_ID=36898 /ORGANISM="Pyramimonas sp., Strain CCMP2087" /LENGTH=265 /DNA_ID=CAMNT_0043874265 /DNA_START=456 /DNA_END=1253 /DNA_ORIENTATION=-
MRAVDTTKPKMGVYSSWQRRHSKLAAEAQVRKESGGADLVMFGDSHMEAFRGTANPSILNPSILQKEYAVFQDVMRTTRELQTVFGVPAHIHGISGDSTQGLLYRLQNGEMDSPPPKVATVHIGNNDVAMGINPMSVAKGVEENLKTLLLWGPNVQIVLIALFPRVDDVCGRPKGSQCPSEVPLSSSFYTEPLREVNERLERLAESHPRVHFVNCNARFILRKGTDMYLNTKIFKDGLHILDFSGAQEFLACLKEPVISALGTLQ